MCGHLSKPKFPKSTSTTPTTPSCAWASTGPGNAKSTAADKKPARKRLSANSAGPRRHEGKIIKRTPPLPTPLPLQFHSSASASVIGPTSPLRSTCIEAGREEAHGYLQLGHPRSIQHRSSRKRKAKHVAQWSLQAPSCIVDVISFWVSSTGVWIKMWLIFILFASGMHIAFGGIFVLSSIIPFSNPIGHWLAI